MVSKQSLFVGVNVEVEGRFIVECPGVYASHHHVIRVAAPIRSGNTPELKSVARDIACRVDVRSFAHVQKWSVAVERKLCSIVAIQEFERVFTFVRLIHFAELFEGIIFGQRFTIEPLAFFDDTAHGLFEFGEILVRYRLRQNEIVVEAVLNGRPKSER